MKNSGKFITIPIKDYFKNISNKVPFMVKLGKFISSKIIKFYIKKIAKTKDNGTLDWIEKNNEQKIKAFFGYEKSRGIIWLRF